MNIKSYLDEQKRLIERGSKHIKDFAVFDFNYIPEEPLMRDEGKMLIDEMLQFRFSGIPNHVAIVGGRGSGKTLTVRYLQRVMAEHADLEVIYGNCRHQNTSFKLLAHFLDVQARGASMTELFERFCCTYRRKMVVVLDEIDLMSPKDRRREILYLLSRSEQPYMVVMLSNSPQVLKELDAATRSSLQPLPVHFKNYNAPQIREILLHRAQRGLHRWDDAHLDEIAALTTRLTNSDARVAIKTFQYTVTRPGQDLRTSFEQARRDLVIDLINDLSDGTLMILWAAATSRVDFAKEIYQRYCRFCRQRKEKPFSYVYFHSNLSYLQSVSLVALVSTKQDRTYATRVVPTFDAAIVTQICTLRFEQ